MLTHWTLQSVSPTSRPYWPAVQICPAGARSSVDCPLQWLNNFSRAQLALDALPHLAALPDVADAPTATTVFGRDDFPGLP